MERMITYAIAPAESLSEEVKVRIRIDPIDKEIHLMIKRRNDLHVIRRKI
jgi:hypothetical protein